MQTSSPDTKSAADTISAWPEESREAAQLVIDTYGEPQESTVSELTWREAGSWKRIVAQKAFWKHDFPAPHSDSVETFIDYRVPIESFGPLAEFDGSVVVERTTGEVSARCHDEQANCLALNLMHEIVIGAKDVSAARAYYAKEFLDARRKQPTPYMNGLRFNGDGREAPDPDVRVLSDEDLSEAERQGKATGS